MENDNHKLTMNQFLDNVEQRWAVDDFVPTKEDMDTIVEKCLIALENDPQDITPENIRLISCFIKKYNYVVAPKMFMNLFTTDMEDEIMMMATNGLFSEQTAYDIIHMHKVELAVLEVTDLVRSVMRNHGCILDREEICKQFMKYLGIY